uniref:Large ribosomal subunit protein bL9c n=1 Tax=Sarcopeltis skottsbergii TaxID=2765380 RepID=A0A7M3VH48_SARSK|nr:50S ribosomal protein L9 [Sarcopeltis skottsbergii]
MKKSIEIILTNSNNQLGKRGDIIKVASGYAFNYLIPKHLAELVTKGKLKHHHMIQRIEDKQLKEKAIQARKIQTQLQKISKISISKKFGERQQIFGSINEKEILNTIFNYTGQKFEKKQIKLQEIKNLGIYHINIQILNNISVEIKLQILPKLKGYI